MATRPFSFALWTILLSISLKVRGQEEYYDYDVNASEEANDGSSDGDRLVGASRGNVEKIPFIVGYKLFPGSLGTSCTGSLITRHWILSAAHCIISLVFDRQYDDCANGRNNYKSGKVTCDWLPGGNLRINIKPRGIAYLGVVDANKEADIEKGYKAEIDYVIKHNQSYLAGGSYGTFGGYDIALVHVSAPVPDTFVTACLPGPHFPDNGIGPAFPGTENANLAGFGKYERRTCLTDGYGPSKFHNCIMRKNSRTAEDACFMQPAPVSKICRMFLSQNIEEISADVQDIIVIDHEGIQNYCHRRRAVSPSRGWCPVSVDASIIGSAHRVQSWGFCSKDCFLHDQGIEPTASVLRTVKAVDILPNELCDKYLEIALKHQVAVRPEILCIGYMKEIKYVVYQNVGKKFIPLEPKDAKHKLLHTSGLEKVVHSAGTCNGDSGGPVFIKHDKTGKYVVLGVVSGGRGILSNCGGMNNPTHYARVKKFGKWIRDVLGSQESEDLCFVEN